MGPPAQHPWRLGAPSWSEQLSLGSPGQPRTGGPLWRPEEQGPGSPAEPRGADRQVVKAWPCRPLPALCPWALRGREKSLLLICFVLVAFPLPGSKKRTGPRVPLPPGLSVSDDLALSVGAERMALGQLSCAVFLGTLCALVWAERHVAPDSCEPCPEPKAGGQVSGCTCSDLLKLMSRPQPSPRCSFKSII